jgi:G:T-mismatch repair DNA endonuclease (very short patch repair protein)
MKCFICKQDIKPNNQKHIYYCAKKNNVSLKKDEIRYQQICYMHDCQFTKKLIEDKYIKFNYSLPDFKKEYGLSYRQTQFLLVFFDIPIRTLGDAVRGEKCRSKYKQTCTKKYGVDNVSKIEEIKKKKKKTFLNHYGVDNIFKDSEFKEKLNKIMLDKYGKLRLTNPFKIKEYYKNLTVEELHELSNLNKKKSLHFWDNVTDEQLLKWKDKKSKSAKDYWRTAPEQIIKEYRKRFSKTVKKWWNDLSDEEKNRITISRIKRLSNNFVSKLEKRVGNVLYDLGITYTSQFQLRFYSFDFLIGKKVLLEVNGDFWHANPLFYKGSDIMPFPGGSKTVQQIWSKDKRKKTYAEKRGYKIIYIWENDIKKLDEKELLFFIKNKIKELSNEN